MRPRAHFLATVIASALLFPSGGALAQSTAGPDTIRAAPTRPVRGPVGPDRDRFELGAAVVSGPFDLLGTFAYHRFIRSGGPFEQWVHLEATGGSAGYLKEGTLSVGYLARPLRTIRRRGPIQPILEAGPAGHLVVQSADVEGFGESANHAHGYMKIHGYAGFDLLLGTRLGLVARGRLSVPAHRPLDYAQIALFLR